MAREAFVFSEFGGHRAGRRAASAADKPAPEPVIDPTALAKARAEGRAEGLAQGRREAEAALDAQERDAEVAHKEAQTIALTAACEAFAELGAARAAAQGALSGSTARLAAAMLQRIAPRLSDAEASRRAEDFVGEVTRAAAGASRLTLRVGAGAYAIANAALGQTRVDALDVVLDPALSEFAVEADWLSGAASFDPAQDTALLVEATTRALAALQGDNPKDA